MILIPEKSGLVLGYFADHDAAAATFEQLIASGFRRVALLRRDADGASTVLNHQSTTGRQKMLASGGGAMIGATVAGFAWQLLPGSVPVKVLLSGAAILGGAGAGQQIGARAFTHIPPSMLDRFAKWLMRDESLVMVLTAPMRISRAQSVLTEAQSRPTIFIRRPLIEMPEADSTAKFEVRQGPASPEQLQQSAQRLAARHLRDQSSAETPHKQLLLSRLLENQRTISALHEQLGQAAKTEGAPSLSAEWLLDNHYIIQEQIEDVKTNLGQHFYNELPRTSAGAPRVYEIAMELIGRTDGRLDVTNITAFLKKYQEVLPLSIGELWALPQMLRLALIEHQRGLFIATGKRQQDRERADFWANRLLNAAHRDPDRLHGILAALAEVHEVVHPHFVERLISHLYDEDSAMQPVQIWLERKCKAPLTDIANEERTRHAADQIAIANTIGSQRALGQMDWNDIFEQISLVHEMLAEDPAGIYSQMNFKTRNSYRREVEYVAKHSVENEIEVSERLLELTRQHSSNEIAHHVGYYLLDGGRGMLETACGYHPPLRAQIRGILKENALPFYIGGIGALTVAGALKVLLRGSSWHPLLGLLSIFPASSIGVELVNYLATKLIEPHSLPRLDFGGGIPAECKTIVVIPMMLGSVEDAQEAVDALGIRYLGNIDPQLKFALLADFTDATTATTPGDQARFDAAATGINNLNARYSNAPFYLFLRDRRWSESEAKWMGWERKRGKLEELNRWLLGERSDDPEHLHPVCGDTAGLENIRYVLTLDADTQLPPECARHLVETIAHPLNQAHSKSTFNGVVQRGYTIIQPRVSVSMPSANANHFTRFFAGGVGTDPYTHAVSDVYQDLFNQSSFQGKGIYDLAAFHQHLGGRFPDATILSHDLLEGEHVRTGLASEIELFDDFPSSYLADTSRVHRWIRGDWQIADWATPRVPDNQGRLVPNPLSLLSRWKVADNLRRSLVKPALVGILLGGWTFGAAPIVSTLAAGCLLIPAGLQVLSLFTPPWDNWPQKLIDLRDSLLRGLIDIAFLPHNATIATDAIIKVWQRRLLTKHDLLEWQTAQSAARGAAGRQQNLLRQSILGSAGSLAGIGLLAAFAPASLPWALPFLGLWSAVPLILRWLQSGTPVSLQSKLHDEDRQWLRRVARRTWRYFDDFVGPQTNWLPPDNYQETLQVEMALRTSPTNIGLWLLAVLAAHDFGYLPLDDAIGRVLETLRVTAEMEKYNGHLLNWYNTETLEPLRPRYVSTVDSGNLLGALTALESGFRECQNAPLLGEFVLDGALDSIAVLEETLQLPDDEWGKEIADLVGRLKVLLGENSGSPQTILSRLREALPLAENLTLCIRPQESDLKAISFPPPSNTLDPRQGAAELNYWVAALEQQLQGWNHLCNRYLQWYEILAETTPEFLAPLGAEVVAARQNLLESIPSLDDLGHGNLPDAKVLLAAAENLPQPTGLHNWLIDFKASYERAQWLAGEMLASNHELLDRARKLADEMDLQFLYDPALELFTIGFDVDELRHDSSYYDLMSSECRIASLVAIARGDVPVEHWWSLGRRFARAYGQTVMLSWSGTMFEYLMPVLLHEQRQNTLLYKSSQAAVQTQMQYAKRRGIPWGISEAAFSALDANSIYQYKAFGVPELGLQRGHENDLVVAPYASLLALQIAPRAAIDNLKILQSLGAYGVYGFYDSVDFSRQRLNDSPRQENLLQALKPFQQGERGAIVRTFMVHHQGMGLLAISNLLMRCGGGQGIMQHRFHADPRIRAITPLLHERVPAAPVLLSAHQEQPLPERKITSVGLTEPIADKFRTPDTPAPHAHLMSNGHYHLMVSNAGGGYSKWNNFDITRWRADTTTDSMGSFFYIRDVDSRVLWSAAHHPVRRAARYQNIDFKTEKVDFRRRDADIETQTEVFVSPEDDVEIRLITLTNHSTHARNLEITSYQELALAPHATDRAHPAFAKLFVQTEALQKNNDCALLAWRRLREPSEDPIWAAHFFTAGDQPNHSGRTKKQSCSFETSREHFLGRGRSPHRPIALETGLTGTAGAVLDPVFSLQQRWALAPGERLQLAAITAAGASRAKVLSLIEKYRDFSAVKRAADMAWTHAQLEMHHLRIQPEEAQLYQQLSGGMIYPQAHYRARSAQLRQNNLGQQDLWSMGISGDLPIIVATLTNERDIGTIRQVLMAHTFWNLRGLQTDLVILNRQSEGYAQTLTEQIQKLVMPHTQYTPLDKPGGIFIRSENQLDKEHLTLLLASAHVVAISARGSLARQLAAPPPPAPTGPRLVMANRPQEEPSPALPFMELPYFNGLGGFTTDGKEFAIYLGPGAHTPAPWINVMANPRFGQMVSESGHGYVWHGNSQSNRLTDWSNDPTMDPINDLIYIRDDQSGAFWSPTPGPIRENDASRARHGQGYTIWEHNSHAIEQELLSFVPLHVSEGRAGSPSQPDGALGESALPIENIPPGDKSTFTEESLPIRIQRLRLKNVSSHTRKLTITSYHEWVLGENSESTALHVSTQWDNKEKILLAENSYHSEFGQMKAFSSSYPPAKNFNADRTLFVGRNQSLRSPAAMRRRQLIDRCGAGLDPCAALQFTITLEPDEEQTVFFFMGQTTDVDEIRQLVRRFRDPAEVEKVFAQTKASWDLMLETLQVETPILSTNFLLNRWLLYQNLSCRFWGRSAFYQSGGAFGFRDQLQDVMALVYMRPDLARRQLLRASAHQFEEGDVQHWWHEASGAGVRTRISDDLLWLPYVAMHYMDITGDHKVLLEEEHFLHADPLPDDEHEKYFSPGISEEKATLYEHCCRAIDKGATSGANGLPLIGTGDWNDGLNAVGEGGKGESIWLGWFLVDVLRRFAEVCETQNDKARAKRYRQRATRYVKAIEKNGWDGEWYRRAYYDDGTPIGSAQNVEDKIDVLPQAWSVISGAGDTQRAEQALQSAVEHLVKRDDKMVLLFTPPFDKSEKNPGYIKGYLPGVRENGGQYTHGALWLALAFAMQGNGGKAVDLLQLLNPVEHAKDADGLEKYKVEPYVVAADVYALEGQIGRGGWTWYTGSAGWMYRVWIEGVLGFQPRADKLFIHPNIPADWKEYKINWRYKSTFYQVHILNPDGKESSVSKISVDGEIQKTDFVALTDDGKTHQVEVVLG